MPRDQKDLVLDNIRRIDNAKIIFVGGHFLLSLSISQGGIRRLNWDSDDDKMIMISFEAALGFLRAIGSGLHGCFYLSGFNSDKTAIFFTRADTMRRLKLPFYQDQLGGGAINADALIPSASILPIARDGDFRSVINMIG